MPRTFSDTQVSWVVYALRDLIARRRIQNNPIPNELLKLHHLLTTTSADDTCGSESDTAEAELRDDDLINSDEAAAILGCSSRWVRAIRADLDGRKVNGRWLFPDHHVVEYADNRNANRVA